MRNTRVDSSTDSELDRRLAEDTQPYNLVEVTVTTGKRSMQLEDCSPEHVEPRVETLSAVMPGRELRENMLAYTMRIEDFKKRNSRL